jgi:hypothetical protein
MVKAAYLWSRTPRLTLCVAAVTASGVADEKAPTGESEE